MNRRLGCLTGGGLLAATLMFALLLIFYVVRGGAMFSPGRLNAQPGEEVLGAVVSHAETGGNCAACHTSPWSPATMADRCLACHTSVAGQLASSQGLHAELRGQATAFGCRGCHREHRGETAALTDIDPATFPHAATGYSLTGHATTSAGQPFACGDCHTQSISGFAVATCSACHRQIDAAYMTAHLADFGDDCLACHDGVDNYSRKTFDHNAVSFRLDGEHARVACGECHIDARSIADLQAAKNACIDCHRKDDEHDGQFGADCAACHSPASWDDAKIDHSKTAFPLTGKHVDVQCEQCHLNGVFKGTPQQCIDCHRQDDEHDGGFGADCAACHSPASWDDAEIDHSKTAFPLTGKHVDVQCEQCHPNGVFKGTPQQCIDCHRKDDEHDGGFGADCAACHNTTSWPDAQFDHATTAFPLTGKHVDVKCQDCHKNGQYKGVSTQCVACHADPEFHRGAFGAQCIDCHAANGWQPATFNAPHTFPLDHGEREPSSCRTCHPQTVTAYTCYGCHEHTQANVMREHAGEVSGDITDCVRCHPTGQEGEGEGRGGRDD